MFEPRACSFSINIAVSEPVVLSSLCLVTQYPHEDISCFHFISKSGNAPTSHFVKYIFLVSLARLVENVYNNM